MRPKRNSRLSRTSEKQNKRQAWVFGIATIALIVILIQFGPLLINLFGNAVYMLRGGDASDAPVTGKELLQPPSLSGIPEATQSAKISFSGTAPDTKGTVEIYVNDELEDEVELNKKADFQVNNISIKKGSNSVKARFVLEDKTSPFTPDFTVNYITDKPKLEVSNPVDNAIFTKADKSIQVKGTTDEDNTVTINSFRAIVESDGQFSYQLQLNDGENQIIIEATNPAGISTQKTIKATYQP